MKFEAHYLIGLLIAEYCIYILYFKKKYPQKLAMQSFLLLFIRQFLIFIFVYIGIYRPAYYLYEHRIFDFKLSSFVHFFVLFIFIDFLFYWIHRLHHEIRIFWVAHSTHHMSRELLVVTALNQSISSIFITPYWFIIHITSYMGIKPTDFFMLYGLNILYQAWIHNTLIPKLGWLEYVLNTPFQHRLHHSLDPAHRNKNYGGVFSIFDQLFGTFTLYSKPNLTFGVIPQCQHTSIWAPIRFEFEQYVYLLKNRNNLLFILRFLFGKNADNVNFSGGHKINENSHVE